MAIGYREVDELNDYSASTVVPAVASDTEPALPPADDEELTAPIGPKNHRLMLCSYCAKGIGEIKCMGGFGPCASCGIPERTMGPVTEAEVQQARAYLERMAELGEGLERAGLADAIRADMVAAGYQAPAPVEPPAYTECNICGCERDLDTSGVCAQCDEAMRDADELGPVTGTLIDYKAPAARIITPGIDDVLDAFESEEDVVNANRELLEGRPLTKDESAKWQRLVNEILREANKRLKAKGIVLISAVPEPNGLGAVFVGCDSVAFEAAERGVSMPSDEYLVTFTLPARERVDIQRASNEDFVRWALDLICAECIEQQKAYRAKAGMH